MPTTLKFTKSVGTSKISPTVRWPSNSRLSEDEKTALAAYTREVEQTVRNLAEVVREMHTALNGASVGQASSAVNNTADQTPTPVTSTPGADSNRP